MGLLPAKSVEKHDDIVPSFEVVTAKKDGRTKKVGVLVARDKIVAIEQVAVVAEHHTIECGCIKVLFHPRHLCRYMFGGVCWRWRKYVNVVVFDKHFVGLVHAGHRLLVAVGQRIGVDEYDRALSACLSVVYLAYQWYEIV